MDKSFLTNCVAVVVFSVGYHQENTIVLMTGLFALSGAATNWLAVHMLFEKIPGLYGSGIIPARFEDFKHGIRALMMEQFFTSENIDRFLVDMADSASSLDLAPVIDNADLNPVFESLVQELTESSFSSMLSAFVGNRALAQMKGPFIKRFRSSLVDISQTESFQDSLRGAINRANRGQDMQHKIGEIVEKRLDEITPQLVKEIIQKMIRKHLGWLVVWGGIFGGLIGLATGLLAAL